MKNSILMLLALCAFHSFAAENLASRAEFQIHPYPDKAPLMVDGKMDTQWVGYTGENARGEFVVLFPEPVRLQTVALFGRNLVSGTVEFSADGAFWDAAQELNAANQPEFLAIRLDEPREIKAIRFRLSGGAERAPVAVRELYIYVPDGEKNLATFRKVSEKGENLNWRSHAGFLVDGNSATACKHYSGYQNSVIELDLGSVEEVSSVALTTGAPIGRLAVSVSTDGTNWTAVKEAAGLASNTPLAFPPVKARYLKLELQGTYRVAPSELIVR